MSRASEREAAFYTREQYACDDGTAQRYPVGDYLDDPVHECAGCGYFTREPRICLDCQADSR